MLFPLHQSFLNALLSHGHLQTLLVLNAENGSLKWDYSFATPVVVPAGVSAILVEVSQEANGIAFFLGCTAAETDDSYLSSIVCGLPECLRKYCDPRPAPHRHTSE